ncbi:hypothetical protein [Shouchella clausii]|uniref:hypothetical protein n=1 Tax=Shouchella clausii TaxID=79880 RepID=UPI00311D830E
MTEAKRPRKRFTVEFKKQLVHLYGSGKPRAEIIVVCFIMKPNNEITRERKKPLTTFISDLFYQSQDIYGQLCFIPIVVERLSTTR